VKSDKLSDPVNVRLFGARGVVQTPDGGANSFNEGHTCGPEDEVAACWRHPWIYRRGAGASCGKRMKFQTGSGHLERAPVGAGLALRGLMSGRGLAAGIRGYTLTVYPRRWGDRRLPVDTYPQKYGDRLRGCAAYPREYGDRLRRLAAYRQKSGDRLWVAVDCGVGQALVRLVSESTLTDVRGPCGIRRYCSPGPSEECPRCGSNGFRSKRVFAAPIRS